MHAIARCPATGAADWHLNIAQARRSAAHSCNLAVPLPIEIWMERHHLLLLAALIPQSMALELPLSSGESSCFLFRLHLLFAQHTAEIFRRRQELMETNTAATPSVSTNPSVARRCPLPPERQLSVSDLRQLESQRREHPPLSVSTPGSGPCALPPALLPIAPVAPAPASGEPRRRWLKERLIRLINKDTVVCPTTLGTVGPCLLELFERITGEPFSETPGALLTNRVRYLSKVMGNLVQEVTFNPPTGGSPSSSLRQLEPLSSACHGLGCLAPSHRSC